MHHLQIPSMQLADEEQTSRRGEPWSQRFGDKPGWEAPVISGLLCLSKGGR